MKIVALGGSLRPHSLTYQALQLGVNKIDVLKIPVELLDLRQMDLPFCTGEAFYPMYPDVEIFRDKIRSSTGILLATPEYHGNMSGVLKNALDLLDEEHTVGKVVGLIAVVGGIHSTNALNTMRLICRQLRCWVLPEQIVIPYADENFDARGDLKDQELEARYELLINHLVSATKKLGHS